MNDSLEDLNTQFNRADQEIKREIGEYLYNRPAQWIPKSILVNQFDIDESGVTRHVNDLHEEGYLQTKYVDRQLYVQWEGRGAGGIEYWLRELIPPQMWEAGSNLRPLLTLESLGGAYIPTLFFGILLLSGLLAGLIGIVIALLPAESLFGVEVIEVTLLTGMITVMASTFFFLIPFSRLLERFLWRLVNYAKNLLSGDSEEE